MKEMTPLQQAESQMTKAMLAWAQEWAKENPEEGLSWSVETNDPSDYGEMLVVAEWGVAMNVTSLGGQLKLMSGSSDAGAVPGGLLYANSGSKYTGVGLFQEAAKLASDS